MALVTNPNNYPEAYVRAVSQQRVPERGTISITELLMPPQMRALWLQHHEDLVLEAGADDHDLFHGNAVHYYLAAHAGAEAIAEERLTTQVGRWLVHGTPDYAELSGQDWLGVGEGGRLIDWKTTRVRALKYDREEWEQQTNLYAYLLQVNGVSVSQIEIHAFLKDWDPQKRGEDGYPSHHCVKLFPPLWPMKQAHDFLVRRLNLHEAAEDGQYVGCTPDERWQRTTYAIVRKGNQRATKASIKDRELALSIAEALTPELGKVEDWYDIREDTTQPIRCQAYCKVRAFCPQWQAELPPRESDITVLIAEA